VGTDISSVLESELDDTTGAAVTGADEPATPPVGRTERVIAEPVIAAITAHAILGTPGVAWAGPASVRLRSGRRAGSDSRVPNRNAAAEVTERLLAALRTLEGLRPWSPLRRSRHRPVRSWQDGALAIDVGAAEVAIRLVATRLPLPPHLDAAEAAVRRALADTGWATACLRLIVTDLDPGALSAMDENNESGRRYRS
jgi:hypothetical protein